MNFAINTTEEMVDRGNKILEALLAPGEKKADALGKLFALAEQQLEGTP